MLESFFSTLKHELGLDVDAEILKSPQQLIRHLAFWIDDYYIRKRLHLKIYHHSPIDYEQQLIDTRITSFMMP